MVFQKSEISKYAVFERWSPDSSIIQIGPNMSNAGKKVQVGKDQEKAQSERDSHSKNRGGEKTN